MSSDVPIYYTLLSGAVGALIVFVLTVGSGWVVRTRQRGRELSGLARVIRPEMERNADVLMILRKLKERGALSPEAYQREHPIYDAWRDTRIKLAELMQPEDFRVLSYFYEELELLDHTAPRSGRSMEDAQKVDIRLAACEESSLPAMRIVDGYAMPDGSLSLGGVPALSSRARSWRRINNYKHLFLAEGLPQSCISIHRCYKLYRGGAMRGAWSGSF